MEEKRKREGPLIHTKYEEDPRRIILIHTNPPHLPNPPPSWGEKKKS